MTRTLRTLLKGALVSPTNSVLATVIDGDVEAVVELRLISATVDGKEMTYQTPTRVYKPEELPKDYGGTGRHH